MVCVPHYFRYSTMTVIFGTDWALYPTAEPDYDTKNKSFLQFSALLKSMGVKNHAFMLALHNQALKGIDPHDPYLTLTQQAMVIAEAKQNFWYFIRECAKAPAEGSSVNLSVEAHRGNIALWWAFLAKISGGIYLELIRQTGKSFAMYVLVSWLLNMGCLNSTIAWATKDDALRRSGITLLKEIIGAMPPYMDFRGKHDVNNGEEVTVKELGNNLATFVAQQSAKLALNQARGFTTPIFFGDELPYQANCHISLPVALAATSRAIDNAKLANAPYGIVQASTSGKRDTEEGRFVYSMIQGFARWDECFYDTNSPEELERIVRANAASGEFGVFISMNHRQLGKSDAWLKEVLQRTRASGEAADRDFFNRWTSGSMSSPFEIDDMEAMRASVKESSWTQIHRGAYITRWYVPKEEGMWRIANRGTVVSLDTSEASGGDDISLVWVDIQTGETICAGSYNETNIIKFCEWLVELIVASPKMVMIIERRSTGSAILDYLMYMLPALGIDPFRRLFNLCVQNAEEDRERFQEISTPLGRRDPDCLVRYKKTFGFATAGSGMASRTELYGTTLQAAVKQVGRCMYDKKLVDQTLALQIRNGRVDHPKGEHDDMVIGWLLAHWFITRGKNLSFYGLDATAVYRDIRPEVTMTPAEQYQHQMQQGLRGQIEYILNQLGDETDEMIIAKLESQLRQLSRRVVVDDSDTFSVDELIRKMRETRQRKRRERAYGSMSPSNGGGVSRMQEHRVMTSDARSAAITGHFQNADNPDPLYGPGWRRR